MRAPVPSHQPIGLQGRSSRIVLTRDAAPPSSPVICSSVVGYSPLGGELGRWPSGPKGRARRAAAALSDRSDGLLLLLARLEGAPRPIALVQRQEGPFYRDGHPDRTRSTVWRDFYYAVGYQLPLEIDRMWASDAISLTHPTDHGWPAELSAAFGDGLGHLADDHALRLSTIHVNGCCLQASENPFAAATAMLGRETQVPSRALDVEELPADDLAKWAPGDEIRFVRVRLDMAASDG